MYQRDFSGATLEDQFDKTVLPKVMQVKNFGRSGRTKYTHLVDQDTTKVLTFVTVVFGYSACFKTLYLAKYSLLFIFFRTNSINVNLLKQCCK